MTRAAKQAFPVHATYMDAHVQNQIRVAYKANALPSVQLQGFLLPAVYSSLVRELAKTKFSDDTIADRYSRGIAKAPKSAKVFSSSAFKMFVKKVTGKTVKGKVRVERYARANYTLRNDEEKPPGLLVYFDMTATWHASRGGATIISDAHGELARVQPAQNTLVLVDCSKAWPFLQYVNHYAEKDAILRLVIE